MALKLKVFFFIVLMMMLMAIGMNTSKINDIRFPDVQQEQIQMIDCAMRSVVAVYCQGHDTPASGFYIGNGIIVTAGHVTKLKVEKVMFENGHEYFVVQQIAHSDYDCGFLVAPDVNEPILRFDNEGVVRGDALFILGNPIGLPFMVSKGVMSGYSNCDGFFGDAILMIYDLVVAGGSSGAPIVDKEGEIVAVQVGYIFKAYAAGISKNDILKALEQAGLSVK